MGLGSPFRTTPNMMIIYDGNFFLSLQTFYKLKKKVGLVGIPKLSSDVVEYAKNAYDVDNINTVEQHWFQKRTTPTESDIHKGTLDFMLASSNVITHNVNRADNNFDNDASFYSFISLEIYELVTSKPAVDMLFLVAGSAVYSHVLRKLRAAGIEVGVMNVDERVKNTQGNDWRLVVSSWLTNNADFVYDLRDNIESVTE